MSISTQEEVVRVAFCILKEGGEAVWSRWSPFRAGGPDGCRFRKGRRGSETGSHGVRWDAAQDRAHSIAVRGLVQLGNGLGGVRNAGEGDVRPVSDPVQEDGVVCPREGRPEVVTRGLPGQKRQAGAVREPQPGMLPLQEGEQKAGAEGVVPGGTSLSSRTEQANSGPRDRAQPSADKALRMQTAKTGTPVSAALRRAFVPLVVAMTAHTCAVASSLVRSRGEFPRLKP